MYTSQDLDMTQHSNVTEQCSIAGTYPITCQYHGFDMANLEANKFQWRQH